jgi:hypothetical protein
MSEERRREAAKAGLHWLALSLQEQDAARYAASRGEYAGVHVNKARTYGKTARALALESQTGMRHCGMCGTAHTGGACRPCGCKREDCPFCTPQTFGAPAADPALR